MSIHRPLRVLAVSAPAAALVIGLGGAIWLWTAPGDRGDAGKGPEGSHEVTCAQAMEFAGGNLPAGVHDEKCWRVDSPHSTVTGSFRFDRSGLDAWLASAFPQAPEYARDDRPAICPKPGPGFDPEGGDRCLGVDRPDAVPGRAPKVRISVEQQTGYDVRIRFVAYDG